MDSNVLTVNAFRVLYIDENPESIRRFVNAFGETVSIEVADNQEDALNQLRQESPPDLVFMNADMDGLAFLEMLKASPFLNSVSVILIFSELTEANKAEARRLHATDVFAQDVQEETLRTRINYLIRKKEYTQNKPTRPKPVPFRMPIGKRLFDILVSGTALLFLSPIMLLVALFVRLDSKGPIFYKSKRVGAGYKLFYMIKFRTMKVGADQQLAGMSSLNLYNKSPRESAVETLCETCKAASILCQKPLFIDDRQVCEKLYRMEKKGKAKFMKFRQDPRVTRLGQFLRNSSLDELPQLINIFRGDMSLVGNRPLPPYEAEKLTTAAYARRFAAPAGLTGLWQVTKRGKSDMSDEERIQLDVLYAKSYSFRTDLVILIRTVKALMQKENV